MTDERLMEWTTGFLIHRVELKAGLYPAEAFFKREFLIHRVELKAK